MKDIKVLDCTLRDGGFVNDFNFGKKTIRGIFGRLSKAGIDIIEVGYLYDKKEFDSNYTRFGNTDAIKDVLKDKKTDSMVVAIVDYGDCDISRIKPVNETNLNGIRVTFKKKDIQPAAEFCKAVKAKGYQVFMQPVSVTTYTDQEILNLSKVVNDVSPYAVSIVDTYGLMHSEKVLHYFYLLDHNLKDGITIGFHSHNNFQMAYANCIELTHAHTSRPLILDASCYGMGKSAGNTCTELICMYLNENYNKNYQLSEILEIINNDIMPIYQKTPWGYRPDYYTAAQAKAHPKYVQFLGNKHTLSVSAINTILYSIPEKNKLTFDESIIEGLYLDYQAKNINDTEAFQKLANVIKNKTITLLGPGKSLNEQKQSIQDFINKTKPVVISVNCAPSGFPIDLVFVSNSRRYEQLEDVISQGHLKTIATSNITPVTPISLTFNYAKLIDRKQTVKDTSLLMLLNILKQIPVNDIFLAGFDGFVAKSENFYDSDMNVTSLPYTEKELTDNVGNGLANFPNRNKLHFLTQSLYQDYIR